jgi:hypothetical protein
MVGSEMAQRLSALPYSLPARQGRKERSVRVRPREGNDHFKQVWGGASTEEGEREVRGLGGASQRDVEERALHDDVHQHVVHIPNPRPLEGGGAKIGTNAKRKEEDGSD